MGKFVVISNSEIVDSLKGVRRQYLAGNLKMPQKLDFFPTSELEIGISKYDTYTAEAPHRHATAIEFQYMISGMTEYLDVDTGEAYIFRKGDFYAIMSGTTYAQKCKAGTEILFIKVPSINDKEPVEISEQTSAWFAKRIKTVRTDYFHQTNMPQANSVRPAAAIAIIEENRILMLKRKDNGKWTLPGGTLEYDESLSACALREIKEETGLDVNITDIVGTYTDPDIRIEYSDGEVRREFTVVYLGRKCGGSIAIDEESSDFQWVSLSDVTTLDMALSQKKRINDIIKYLQTGKKTLI